MDDGILRARETFVYHDEDDAPRQITKGTTVRVGHPILAGRESFFEPFSVDYEYQEPAKPGKHVPKQPAPRLKVGDAS